MPPQLSFQHTGDIRIPSGLATALGADDLWIFNTQSVSHACAR